MRIFACGGVRLQKLHRFLHAHELVYLVQVVQLCLTVPQLLQQSYHLAPVILLVELVDRELGLNSLERTHSLDRSKSGVESVTLLNIGFVALLLIKRPHSLCSLEAFGEAGGCSLLEGKTRLARVLLAKDVLPGTVRSVPSHVR